MRKFLVLFLLASILLSACEPTHTPPPVTEVAKYKVWDFGDAPDPEFQTLLVSDGLRTRDPNQFWLGSLEPPGATLEGDANITDLDQQDDGLIELMERSGRVSLTFQAAMSEQAQARVVYFNLWADTNNNGRWEGPLLGISGISEWIVVNREISLAPGETTQIEAEFGRVRGALRHWFRAALTDTPVPGTGFWGQFARGEHQLGEVEDYEYLRPLSTPTPPPPPPPPPPPVPDAFDFGDARDPRFPSLLASDGLRTIDPSQFWLGSLEVPGATLERNANITDLDPQDDGLIEMQDRSRLVSLTFQAAMSEQAQARFVWFNLWADINNDGQWQGIPLPREICELTPAPPNVDLPVRSCGISEWIISNQGIWLRPGTTAQFEADILHYWGNLEHWIRAAITDRPIWSDLQFRGQHQMGEVEDYHLLPPYVLPNRQNPTPTPTVSPTHVAPTPAITKGAYVITDDGFRVTYTGPLKVPPGETLAAPFKVRTPDGSPAKGELTVSLWASASDPYALHATAELDAQGEVTILLNIGDYPAGTILELLFSHLGKVYKVIEITVTP